MPGVTMRWPGRLGVCREDLVVGFVATHVRPHRGALAVSYGAAVIEDTFELLYPFAVGLAVDGDSTARGVG
jgi:hypothetical protein